MDTKSLRIINDFLLFEEFCNLKCNYCGGYYSSEYAFRRRQGNLLMPPSWEEIRKSNLVLRELLDNPPSITQLFELSKKTLKENIKHFEYPILKLSGGEIFIVKETMDFIEEISQDFDSIQILTNGTMLNDSLINRIANLGNVYVQISLDGHTLELNKARTKREGLLKKVLNAINHLQKKEVPVEINTVLTKYNTKNFESFIEYMSQYSNLIIFPRPVRGKPKKIFFPDKESISSFSDYLLSSNSNVLPPKQYLERIIQVINNPTKTSCYIPFFVMGSDMYGNLSRCTLCSDSSTLTNILDQDEEALESIKSNNHHDFDKRYNSCPPGCIVQYEMFNLYVNGKITKEDLIKIPTFRRKNVLDVMEKIKIQIKEKK